VASSKLGDHPLKNCGFTCTHAYKPLSNDYHSELETDWIGRAGFVVYPSLTWCLNRCLGQWFFSQYCRHLLRKPVRTDFSTW